MTGLSTPWRLVVSTPAQGKWNMAVDEAILEAIGQAKAPPTLRLYAWEPACLSLGYAQSYGDVDMQRLQERGWEVVRRPTGGRAILHTDELTYSIIGPGDHPVLAGSVLESYRHISGALLGAIRLLGVPAKSSSEVLLPAGGNAQGPVCFEVPSNYEITAGGKKLVGSAQARRKEGVLQHGSLPLYGDLRRITEVLVFANQDERDRAAARVLQRAVTVEEALGKRVEWEEAAQAFTQAFQAALGIRFEPEEISPAEQARASQLVTEKYGNMSWTAKL